MDPNNFASALAPTQSTTLDGQFPGSGSVYTRHDLLTRWSRRQLDAHIENGALTRLLPGIYCAPLDADNPVTRARALMRWHPPGVVTGAVALHLYDRSLPEPAVVDFVVAHGQHLRTIPWARFHQTGQPENLRFPDLVRCAPPAQALLHAWHIAPAEERIDLLYEALWSGVCTWRDVQARLDAMTRIADRRRLSQILRWFAKGATSPLEVKARRFTFAGPAFAELEWQAELRLRSRQIVADALHRRARLVIELDGNAFHGSPEAQRRDRERDRDLSAAGYLTLRYTWGELSRHPDLCREQVLAEVASRTGDG